jgi:hypothetical protein
LEDLSAVWGIKWVLRRDHELLDGFSRGRVKIITDWMVKMGDTGDEKMLLLNNGGDGHSWQG